MDYIVVGLLDQVSKIIFVLGERILMVLQLDKVKLKNSQLEILVIKLDVFGNGDGTEFLLHGSYQTEFITCNKEYLVHVSIAS